MRKKRIDSSYFTQRAKEQREKDRRGRNKKTPSLDICPLCGKEVLWEEAVKIGVSETLAHPSCADQERLYRTNF